MCVRFDVRNAVCYYSYIKALVGVIRLKRALLILLVCILGSVSMASAHGGHTDEHGGHYDYETGVYHYHHGYPAHSHTGGRCPYNFNDQTGINSGSSGSSSYWAYTSAPRPTPEPKPDEDKYSKSSSSKFWVVMAVLVPVLVAIISWTHKQNELERERRRREIIRQQELKRAEEKRKREEEERRKREIAEREEAERRAREEQREAERKKLIDYYAANDLRTITGMPKEYYVDDENIPRQKEIPEGYVYGEDIDVYLSYSKSSSVYHRKGCSSGGYGKPINAFTADWHLKVYERRPCSRCNPKPLPDKGWYKEYIRHINICKCYDIQPLREPFLENNN